MSPSTDLTGKAALVTGAAGGIGGACARALSLAGCHVVAAARTGAAAARCAQELRDAGGDASAASGDLGETDTAAALVEAAMTATGRLDIVVNAAGVNSRKSAIETSADDLDTLYRVNVRGTYLVCTHAAAAMSQGGSIVNITSLTAMFGLPNASAYGTTRGGGVNQLTKSLAVEWAARRIRVNAVAPGRIRTPMTADLLDDAEREASIARQIPMGYVGEPDDVADAVLWLASSGSRYVTGSTIVVDGGLLASNGSTV